MPFQISVLILLLILGMVTANYLEIYARDRALCHLPVHYGICGTRVFAWYYDSTLKICLRFWYALCGGHGNRFYSKKECEDLCLRDW